MAPKFLAPNPFGPRLVAPPLAVPKLLTRNSNMRAYCTAAAVALVFALPVAQGIGAVSQSPVPVQQVNRAAKGDMFAAPKATSRKVPVAPIRNPARPVREQSDKRLIMDGCESSFSPVTVPSMAHIAGRCVG
jgi:hypothetical protein